MNQIVIFLLRLYLYVLQSLDSPVISRWNSLTFEKNYFKRHLATALSWFLYLQNTENRKYNQEASIIFTFLKTYPHISKLYVHINAYIWWKVHTLNQHEKSIILFGFSLSLLSVWGVQAARMFPPRIQKRFL